MKTPTQDVTAKVIRHRAMLLAALREIESMLLLGVGRPDYRDAALKLIAKVRQETKL